MGVSTGQWSHKRELRPSQSRVIHALQFTDDVDRSTLGRKDKRAAKDESEKYVNFISLIKSSSGVEGGGG